MTTFRFPILACARATYVFFGQNAGFVLRLALVPTVAQAATAVFVVSALDDVSILENALWNLPANALAAGFAFLQTRRILCGENTTRLPGPSDVRARALQISVLISLLFGLGVAGVLAALTALTPEQGAPQSGGAAVAAALLVGALIYALRLGMLPVAAAAARPLRPFLTEAGGMMLSFRLIGLGLAVLLPLGLAVQIVLLPFAHLLTSDTVNEGEKILLMILAAPLSVLAGLLLNAAMAFALRDGEAE